MARSYRDRKDLKLNIGCGDRIQPGFLNLDYSKTANIRLDLRRCLPFEDNSCKLIYSEHFVEHLSYPEGVEHFLSETFRVLSSNSTISISVPDTEWPLQQYCFDGNDWLANCKQEKWHPRECTTVMEHLNYHFRQRWRGRPDSHFECHRFAYDFTTIEKKLKEVGFVNIQKRNFDSSLDSPCRKIGSLFVQASKP